MARRYHGVVPRGREFPVDPANHVWEMFGGGEVAAAFSASSILASIADPSLILSENRWRIFSKQRDATVSPIVASDHGVHRRATRQKLRAG